MESELNGERCREDQRLAKRGVNEAEVRLRSTISSNSITGYEVYCSVSPGNPYCHIARWNGPNGSYCNIDATSPSIVLVNGDTLTGTVSGTNPVTITGYRNGTQIIQATDSGQNCSPGGAAGPWTSGNPGIGFYSNVDAWNSFGLSSFSANNSSGSDTTPPSTPANLAATAVSSSQINLAWTASTDNVAVTGYKVFRNGTQVGTATTNSYSDTGLTASTAYSYTVSAYDAAGNNSAQSSSASATTLPPPPTVVLSASPQSIGTGDSSTLSWTSTNATSCTGTGFSTGGTTSGSAVVTPAATTVYSISCTGAGGTGTNTVTVSVGALGALPTIDFPSGTFTWTTTNAVSCTATGGWSGTQPTSGSYAFNSPVSATYILTCTGGGTSVQRTITITASETATVSSKFQIGSSVTTSSALNVRSTPSTSGTLLGSQPAGITGTVTGGPVQANGYWWWQVNYATGPDGWSVENWLN